MASHTGRGSNSAIVLPHRAHIRCGRTQGHRSDSAAAARPGSPRRERPVTPGLTLAWEPGRLRWPGWRVLLRLGRRAGPEPRHGVGDTHGPRGSRVHPGDPPGRMRINCIRADYGVVRDCNR